jgi:hypothetical protein
MTKYYAGIGSRRTPEAALKEMQRVAGLLEDSGFILRSGAADGADTAFELGVKDSGNKQIFVPWGGFQDHEMLFPIPDLAWEIAKEHHPVFNILSPGAKKLMARNTMQVLGPDCKTPSKFILFWAPQDTAGVYQGGTSQALRIAKAYNIPRYQVGDHKYRDFIDCLLS